MYTALPTPFAAARTFTFRLYQAPVEPAPAETQAARRYRKLLKKRAKAERLRNFFAWCAGWQAYGSIF